MRRFESKLVREKGRWRIARRRSVAEDEHTAPRGTWVPWMGGHEEIDGFRERMVDRIRMDAGLTSIPSMYPNERVVSVRSPCDEAPDWAEIVAQRNREIDGLRLSEISLPCWAIAESAASPRRSHAKTRLSFCCAALMPKVVLSLAMRVLRRLRGAEPTV